MCLAIPGKIISIDGELPFNRKGQVSFGGILKEVNFAYVPQAQPNDYVLVHVGMAISLVDPDEAQKIFSYLSEMDATADNPLQELS
jgi:hydrogenase expression/formation protein HypC